MVEEAEAGSETSGEPVTFSCRPICRSQQGNSKPWQPSSKFFVSVFHATQTQKDMTSILKSRGCWGIGARQPETNQHIT